jgi:hypothetical protein
MTKLRWENILEKSSYVASSWGLSEAQKMQLEQLLNFARSVGIREGSLSVVESEIRRLSLERDAITGEVG